MIAELIYAFPMTGMKFPWASEKELLKDPPDLGSVTSRKTQPPSGRADLQPSPTSRAAWIPDLPDRQPSRKRRSAHRSRRENTVRRPPIPRRIAPEDQTCGKSWGAPRRDRTTRFRDRARDRAPRWQIPQNAAPPLDLHRVHQFSRSRETPPTTAPPKPVPVREYGVLVAGRLFPGRSSPAVTAAHPVDGWQTLPRSTGCIPDGMRAIRRRAAKHRPARRLRSGSVSGRQPVIAAKTCRKHTLSLSVSTDWLCTVLAVKPPPRRESKKTSWIVATDEVFCRHRISEQLRVHRT
jgi:hypothetical protein